LRHITEDEAACLYLLLSTAVLDPHVVDSMSEEEIREVDFAADKLAEAAGEDRTSGWWRSRIGAREPPAAGLLHPTMWSLWALTP
jgi:hypothetical protein